MHLILKRDEEILFLLRKGTGFMDGHWGLVSGHVEGGEPAREAMAREAYEEAGIIIKPLELEVVHVTHSFDEKEYVAFWMRCSEWEGEIVNREPEKCAKLAFFHRENLPAPIIPFVKTVLGAIDEGLAYSEMFD